MKQAGIRLLIILSIIVTFVFSLGLTTFAYEPTNVETPSEIKTIYGDVNSDGVINALDLLALKKYIAKWQIEIDETAADVNIDGKVNAVDLLFLRKYIAKYNIILGDVEPDKFDFTIGVPQLKVESSNNSATVSWTVSGKWEKVIITDKNDNSVATVDKSLSSYSFSELNWGKKYVYKLKAVNDNEYGHFESEAVQFDFITALKKPTSSVIGKTSSAISISWEKDSLYQNVEIYYSPVNEYNWEHYKTVKADLLTYNIEGLQSGKRYDARLRAVSTIDGKTIYSDYSTKHYGTTKPANISGLKVSSKNDSSITLSWNKSSGAQSYIIYRSTKKDSGFSRIASVKTNSYANSGLKDETTYYYKIRSYLKIGDNEYYSDYSSVISATTPNRIYYVIEKYGTSYQGRDLNAYIFNKNASTTIFCDFAVHGFEDDYYRDGKVLVDCAMKIINYYNEHISELNGKRLVIVPCANPDGTYAGTNNERACSSAFGRCTANHVDMNRDFISGKFKAKESVALRDLIKKYKPKYYINFHGWLDTTLGDSTIGSIFRSTLGLSGNQDGQYGVDLGYIIGWVKQNVGSKACLVEFKSPGSVSYTKVIKGLNQLFK